MREKIFLLLLITSIVACKKRNVIVYDCKCTWTRATTGKDTFKTISLPDMIKGTAETTCRDEETIIPRDTDVKDSVSCALL